MIMAYTVKVKFFDQIQFSTNKSYLKLPIIVIEMKRFSTGPTASKFFRAVARISPLHFSNIY